MTDDVGWVTDHGSSRVQNMPTFDGVKPKREYQAFQLVFNKRYSDRWQALASFLYSNSDGISRRSFRQDFNVEAPMFYRRQLDGEPQLRGQQPRGTAALHAQVRAEAVRLVQDSARRGRPRRALPDAHRTAGLAARGLPSAHGVRGPARRRDHPRWAAADRQRRSQRSRLPSAPEPPRPPSREGLQARRRNQERESRRRWVQHLQLVDTPRHRTSSPSTAG